MSLTPLTPDQALAGLLNVKLVDMKKLEAAEAAGKKRGKGEVMATGEIRVHDVYYTVEINWPAVAAGAVVCAALALTIMLIWRGTRHRP